MRLLPLPFPKLKLLLLTLMHFATDGLCSYIVFTRLYPQNPAYALVIFFAYNILAFVTQSPVGILIDKYNKPKFFLAVSICAMVIGYILSDFWILSVTFVGISNSMFHVAGGKYVTDKSGNDITHLGIFVSTGAIGLCLGQRYASFVFLPYIFFAIIIVCGLVFIFSEQEESKSYAEEYESHDGARIALIAVLLVVLIRSFVGKTVSPDFTLLRYEFLLIAIATALGKAAGGICSKRFGIGKTTYISMAVAAVCLTIGTWNIYSFIFGVFAFNFSMPQTLYFANVILKGKEGFAFGTLAATLAPGYFLAMTFEYSLVMRVFTAIMCILSMITIVILSKRINYVDSTAITNNNS